MSLNMPLWFDVIMTVWACVMLLGLVFLAVGLAKDKAFAWYTTAGAYMLVSVVPAAIFACICILVVPRVS